MVPLMVVVTRLGLVFPSLVRAPIVVARVAIRVASRGTTALRRWTMLSAVLSTILSVHSLPGSPRSYALLARFPLRTVNMLRTVGDR